MTTYSEELVLKVQKHFKEKHNHIIDGDEAQIYLESFATLFLALKK